MSAEDAGHTRQIKREICRRYVDLENAEIRVMHGVCYMRGTITKLRNHPEADLYTESEIIKKIIRQQPFVRDLVWEIDIDPLFRKKALETVRLD